MTTRSYHAENIDRGVKAIPRVLHTRPHNAVNALCCVGRPLHRSSFREINSLHFGDSFKSFHKSSLVSFKGLFFFSFLFLSVSISEAFWNKGVTKEKKEHTNLLEALRDVKGLMQNTMTWGEEKNRGNTERVKKATSRCLAAATFPFSLILFPPFPLSLLSVKPVLKVHLPAPP